jgi:hypothetical protein
MVGHASHVRRPGDQVLLRHVWRSQVAAAYPMTVVEETAEHVVLWLPVGTPTIGLAVVPMPQWVAAGCPIAEREWTDNHRLFVWPRGRAHVVSLLREASTGNEACFYVDALELWRDTPLGWDTCDQELDLVAWPDLSEWFWKDEAEFQERIDLGLLSAEDGAAARAELEAVTREIEAREGVWASAARWRAWRPDPSWPIPELPDGWDVL